MTLIYIDKRLLTKSGSKMIHFPSNLYDFVIYSRKDMKHGLNSFRLPSLENYKDNMKAVFNYEDEQEMYIWLKQLHRTINDINNNYTPFVKDPSYNGRANRVILNGEFWIL